MLIFTGFFLQPKKTGGKWIYPHLWLSVKSKVYTQQTATRMRIFTIFYASFSTNTDRVLRYKLRLNRCDCWKMHCLHANVYPELTTES